MDEEIEMLENALHDLDGEQDPLSEGEAREVLMNLTKQRVSGPVSNMTYRQVQSTKQDLRNSRGFRQVSNKGFNRRSEPKQDVAYLKTVTKCRNCNAVGHWHRECPHRKGQAPQESSSSGNANGAAQPKTGWFAMCEAIDAERESQVSFAPK